MKNQQIEELYPVRAMRRWNSWLCRGAAALLVAAAGNAWCAESSDPLLDLLIQKGILSADEAKKVRAEAEEIRSNNPPAVALPESKWKISKAIKNIELFGDLRLRYENRQAAAPNDDQIRMDRLRYAVRLGLRGEVLDDFYYGVRLDTAANPRSPWVTFGTSASGTPFQGPFGKSTAGIDVGQVFIGWHGLSWLDIEAGKMPNPIYTTPMIWDGDLNPEGLAERLKYTIGCADFFATFGQFLYQDVNPTSADSGFFSFGAQNSNLPFLLAWQGGVNYHITTNVSLKVAPVLYNYTGHAQTATVPPGTGGGTPGFANTYVGQGASNNITGANTQGWSGFNSGYYDGFASDQTGINNLLVLDIPAELNFKICNLDFRVFGDYAQNLDGSDRAEAAFRAATGAFQPIAIAPIPSAQTSDIHAYQAGVAIGNRDSLGLVYGQTSHRHAWEIRSYWQHIEQYALDPNLIDSDFFEGRENLEGIYAAAAYGFNQNIIGTVRYGYAHRINDKIGTGGSNQDIPQINPIDNYHLFQVDLTFRF